MGRGEGKQRASLVSPTRTPTQLDPPMADGHLGRLFAEGRGWGWRVNDNVQFLFDRNGIAVIAETGTKNTRRVGVIYAEPQGAEDEKEPITSLIEVSVGDDQSLGDALSDLQKVAQRCLVLKQGGWRLHHPGSGGSGTTICRTSDDSTALSLSEWEPGEDQPYEDSGKKAIADVQQRLDHLPKRADAWRNALEVAGERLEKEARGSEPGLWSVMAEARFGELDQEERQQIGERASRLRQKNSNLSDSEILDQARDELIGSRPPSTDRLRSWVGQGRDA